jgi:16S rRNA processing protein RimM
MTDVPGRLESLKQANISLKDGSSERVEIVDAWPHKGDWVLKLAGVDSIADADRFRGADLWVPVSERAILPDGEFFRSDLIGCTVIDRSTAACIGVVENWQDYGGPPLMQVSASGRAILIPFVAAGCEVNFAERTIRTDLPAGLLDL